MENKPSRENLDLYKFVFLFALAPATLHTLISSKIPEQVSDRPALTSPVVLAVASHDSVRVRFLIYLFCMILLSEVSNKHF